MTNNRLNQMQFLRVLAFLNIYMLHAGHWNFFNYPGWFGAISAVSFFFMLSGFLTGYSFDENRFDPSPASYGRYMRKKIARFYPLYFITTLYAVSFSNIPQIFASGHFGELIAPVVQLLKNLLCIQSWFPDGYLSYNGPCWFSATLLFLTALNYPFFLFIQTIRRKSKSSAPLYLLLVLGLLGSVLYCYLTRSGSLQFLHYIFPPSRIGAYFSSMILGMLVRANSTQPIFSGKKTGFFSLLEIGALIVWFFSLSHPGAAWLEWNAAWLAPNLLVLLVFSMGKGILSRLFSHPALVRLGDVTFECYLIHSLVIPSYSRYNHFDTTYTLGCLFSLAACFALTYLLALFLHRRSDHSI